MDSSYRKAISEIKGDLKKLERKSGVGFIFAVVIGAALVTLIIVYLVLKFKSSADIEFYDDYSDDDEVFPFDDEDDDDEEEEETDEI